MNSFEEILELAKKFHLLQVLIRFSNINRIKDENVASHSFAVVLTTRLLYDYYKDKFDINYQKLVDIAIIHDTSETLLSDIPHNIKKENEELQRIVDIIEIKIIKKIWNNNQYFTNLYLEYLNLLTVEAKIVRLADCISVYVYSNNEINLGNINFVEIKERVEERIKDFLNELEEIEVNKK